MAIKKTEIIGTKIICEIESSNLVKTEYDTETKKMIAEFKNGSLYEYEDVPHSTYAGLRLSESQGKYFNIEISKKFKYKKVEK
jgi:lysyl-tRNA synthetase class 2